MIKLVRLSPLPDAILASMPRIDARQSLQAVRLLMYGGQPGAASRGARCLTETGWRGYVPSCPALTVQREKRAREILSVGRAQECCRGRERVVSETVWGRASTVAALHRVRSESRGGGPSPRREHLRPNQHLVRATQAGNPSPGGGGAHQDALAASARGGLQWVGPSPAT